MSHARSYGNYNSQVPQKTFSGSPIYPTQQDMKAVNHKIEGLQAQLMMLHPPTYDCVAKCMSGDANTRANCAMSCFVPQSK